MLNITRNQSPGKYIYTKGEYMDNEVSIGHTKSPDLIVSMLNFYFQMQGLSATAIFKEHGMTNKIIIQFNSKDDADQLKIMHSTNYKYFLEIVFKFMMETFYSIGRTRDIKYAVNRSISPEIIANQLLDVCHFQNGDSEDTGSV